MNPIRNSGLAANISFACAARRHLLNPTTISKLQHAVRQSKFETFREFADIVNQQNRDLQMLRGMFDFKPAAPAVPLEEVEPASEIVKRFATGRHVLRLDQQGSA